jgi:pyruvate kinase
MRKTKIICTMGPAVDQDDRLRQLVVMGMNVARLNFSHGTHPEHKDRIERIRRISSELDQPIALMLDTNGPQIRTGTFINGRIDLREGEEVVVTASDEMGNDQLIPVTYDNIHKDLREGSRILIDDGLIELSVQRISGENIICRIVNGGPVSDNKSINLPDTTVNLPPLRAKDIDDLQFAVEHEFDFIAASFTRKPSDIFEIRKVLKKYHGESIHLIAKIENREGVNNFDDILKVADGIMVARGDLGVEIPVQEVPMLQKSMIEKCYKIGKPCITATQMLDSMIRSPRPTRAEVSDVANAIIDGTSAVMLSGETAIGRYPLESLRMMISIAEQTEKSINYWKKLENSHYDMAPIAANAISFATCTAAMHLKAAAIVAVTYSGRTARLISRFRPKCPIIATTVSMRSLRQLALSWGVYPFLVEEVSSTDDMFEMGIKKAMEFGAAQSGDIVVITGGTPIGMSGTTNTLKIQNIGSLLTKGISSSKGSISGEVIVIEDSEDIRTAENRSDYILVARSTNNLLLPLMRQAKAMIVEDDDPSGHAPKVGMALNIPLIYGCENATRIIKSGSVVNINFDSGTIS